MDIPDSEPGKRKDPFLLLLYTTFSSSKMHTSKKDSKL